MGPDPPVPTSSLFSISWSFPSRFYGNTKETVQGSLNNEIDDLEEDSFHAMVDSASVARKNKSQTSAGIAFAEDSFDNKEASAAQGKQRQQQQQQLTPSPQHQSNSVNDDEKTIEDNLSYQFDSSFVDSERSDVNSCGSDSDSDSDSESEYIDLPAITPDKFTDKELEAYEHYSFYEKILHSHFMKRTDLWIQSIRALLKIQVYRNLLGAMTALYFTVTGVQYWGTKYMTIALNAPIAVVNILFVLCAATGPTIGVIFGGWLIDYFGGYKGPRQRVIALEIVTILGISGFLFSLPITFLTNIYYVAMCLWCLLFFGASVLPACSGILVSIVPRAHRTTSSSLSLVIFNMFGYFLSLILSGYLMEVS